MARFIRFTVQQSPASGPDQHFLNLDHVAKAVYQPVDASLTLILASAAPGVRGSVVRLTGQEAQDALRILGEVT